MWTRRGNSVQTAKSYQIHLKLQVLDVWVILSVKTSLMYWWPQDNSKLYITKKRKEKQKCSHYTWHWQTQWQQHCFKFFMAYSNLWRQQQFSRGPHFYCYNPHLNCCNPHSNSCNPHSDLQTALDLLQSTLELLQTTLKLLETKLELLQNTSELLKPLNIYSQFTLFVVKQEHLFLTVEQRFSFSHNLI